MKLNRRDVRVALARKELTHEKLAERFNCSRHLVTKVLNNRAGTRGGTAKAIRDWMVRQIRQAA